MIEKDKVGMPSSKLKHAIAQVLRDEGYIDGFKIFENGGKPVIEIYLKYYAGQPVIEKIDRVSKPGLRVYKGRDDIPRIMNGMGISILSTSQGVMTDRRARSLGVGGEILCLVA
jgi:small subunit ribosomal protein S8